LPRSLAGALAIGVEAWQKYDCLTCEGMPSHTHLHSVVYVMVKELIYGPFVCVEQLVTQWTDFSQEFIFEHKKSV
jgi:hypothetical protein